MVMMVWVGIKSVSEVVDMTLSPNQSHTHRDTLAVPHTRRMNWEGQPHMTSDGWKKSMVMPSILEELAFHMLHSSPLAAYSSALYLPPVASSLPEVWPSPS